MMTDDTVLWRSDPERGAWLGVPSGSLAKEWLHS